MTLNIISDSAPGFQFHYKKLAEKVINYTLKEEAFPYDAEICLTLVDNNEIHDLNKQTRGVDSPTDVLSFPMLEYPAPGDFSLLQENLYEITNPENGEVVLGDIVLSVEKVKSQAAEYGHTEKREYAFLIVHSMLHLLGYDHMEEQDAIEMERKQNDILEHLDIRR